MPSTRATSLLLTVILMLPVSATATSAAAAATSAEGSWPLRPAPEVVHAFDPPALRWGSGHRGVDLAGHIGQTVRSALPGTVTFAGLVAGRGVVVVAHGDTRTTYQPLTATVARGDHVDEGDRIGLLGWFGSHCIPQACLHWGLIEGAETYLNPLSLVGGGPRPVRLLPWGGRIDKPVAPDAFRAGRPAAVRDFAARAAWAGHGLSW